MQLSEPNFVSNSVNQQNQLTALSLYYEE
jgi:hypothetical protein